MFLTKAIFKNFIGIYNGQGCTELEIEFPDRYKFFMIVGENGSGKSSIHSNCTPFSKSIDSTRPSIIIDGEDGYKELHYRNNNDRYIIKHFYKAKSKGSHSVKSYIQKEINGDFIEMNENGNVKSFEECLFNEFSLTKEFILLTNLGINSKGFISMTPTERKNFISPLIRNIEKYLLLYKDRKPKLRDVNSNIKMLNNKVSNIGDKDILIEDIEKLEKTINKIHEELKIVNEKEIIHNNTNKEINIKLEKYPKDLKSQLEKVKDKLNKLSDIKSLDYYIESINNGNEERIEMIKSISELDNKIDNLNSRLYILNNKRLKYVNSLNKDLVDRDTNTLIIERNKLKSQNIDFMINNRNITYDLDENSIEYAYNILTQIKTNIKTIKSEKYINNALDNYINSSKLYNRLTEIYGSIDNLENKRTKIIELDNSSINNSIIKNLKGMKKIECVNCPLIEELNEMESNLNNYNKIELINKEIEELKKEQENIEKVISIIKDIDSTIQYFNLNKKYIDKIRPSFNENMILELLSSKDDDYLEKLNDVNDIMEYVTSKKVVKNNNVKIRNIYNNLKDISENNLKKIAINLIDKEMISIDVDKSILSRNRFNINLNLSKLEKDINEYKDILNIVKEKDNLIKLSNSLNSDIKEYNKLNNEYIERQELLKHLISDKNQLNKSLSQYTTHYENRKLQLNMLNEYIENIESYSEEYRIREIIDNALSPTKGIPLIPMKKFLNDIKYLVSDIIGKMFPDISISDFIVSDREFKIPYVGKFGKSQDISTASGGESAIISLAFSLTLSLYSSNIYNIILMDELDATLDKDNRALIVNIIDNISDELGIEQIISISHNDAYHHYDVGIINLSNDPEYKTKEIKLTKK